MLCQEPWCFRIKDVADLTDWQILNLYYLPAIERAEKVRGQQPSIPGPSQPTSQRESGVHFDTETGIGSGIAAPDPASPEFKGWYVRTMTPWMGREAAEREFEAQKREYETAPADAWWRK